MHISFLSPKMLRGSMTVEASLILPILLFTFLHLMGYLEMLRLHSKLGFALWNVGGQLTAYAAAAESLETEMPDIAVSYIYVDNRVKKILGEEYLVASPLVYGSDGLNYLASDYQMDCIDIGVTYQVRPPISIFPFPYMRLVNRYYGRAWTGYDVAGKDTKFVYVTAYGEVWHETAECSYLQIVVREAKKEEIVWKHNINGKRYIQCKLCEEEGESRTVYYTEQGERYHKDRKCPSLARYIRAVEWQEDLLYRACLKCVGRKEQEG